MIKNYPNAEQLKEDFLENTGFIEDLQEELSMILETCYIPFLSLPNGLNTISLHNPSIIPL